MRKTFAGFLLALALVAAGCGDDDGGTATGSSGGTQAAAAPGASGGLAKAQQIVKDNLDPESQIEITEPITKPIPKNKTLIFVNCGVAACVDIGNEMKRAVQPLGWRLRQINAAPDPAKIAAAFDQVVREKPDAVSYTGFPVAAFQKQLTALKQEGVPLSTCCTTDPVTDQSSGLVANFRGLPEQRETATLTAAWLTQARQGKTHLLYVDLPAFPIYGAFKKAFDQVWPTLCENCSKKDIEVPATSIGKDSTQRIVNAVRQDPKIDAVFVTNDGLALGLKAALKAAGRGDVLIMGQGPSAANVQLIRDGLEDATLPVPTTELAWYQVDALARALAGQKPITPKSTGHMLWTKESIGDHEGLFAFNPNYEEQFKQLWSGGTK